MLRNSLRKHLGTTEVEDLLQKQLTSIASSSMDATKVKDDSIQQSLSILKKNVKLINSIHSPEGTKDADELPQKQLNSGEADLIASSSAYTVKAPDHSMKPCNYVVG